MAVRYKEVQFIKDNVNRMTNQEMADTLGINYRKVNYIMHNFEIVRNNSYKFYEDDEWIMTGTIKEIAEECGYNLKTVYSWKYHDVAGKKLVKV